MIKGFRNNKFLNANLYCIYKQKIYCYLVGLWTMK